MLHIYRTPLCDSQNIYGTLDIYFESLDMQSDVLNEYIFVFTCILLSVAWGFVIVTCRQIMHI